MNKQSLAVQLFLLLIVVHHVAADTRSIKYKQSRQKQAQFRQGNEVSSRDKITAERYASMWGITVADWRRYKTIMKGPRGVWSPRMDPLTALGIHARTTQERKRYARLQVKLEYIRLRKELAYDRAFKQAQKDLFGKQQWVDTRSIRQKIALKKRLHRLQQKNNKLILGDRLLLFVKLRTCSTCSRAAYRALEKISGITGVGLDIYFVGARQKDKMAIQAWAKRMPMSIAQVKSGKITLNYDLGTYSRIARKIGSVPVLLHKRGRNLRKLDL